MIGIVGIDPNIVKVTMRAARNVAEALTAVIAGDERSAWFVDLVLVLWIYDQIRVIKGTPNHVLTAIERNPCFPAIVRAIQAILRHHSFNECIDNVWF